MADARVNFRCSEELLLEIDRYAAARNRDRSSAIREILQNSLLADAERAVGEVLRPMVRRELERAFESNRARLRQPAGADSVAEELGKINESMAAMASVAGAVLWLSVLSAYEEHEGSMDEWRRVALANAADALGDDPLDDPEEGGAA